MARVRRKRPIDVLEHTLDFTGYLTGTVTAADVVIEGETDTLLTAGTPVIASPLVTVALSAGTARGIYQVYVTATAGSDVKRLQFEVQLDGADAIGGGVG